MATAHQLYPPSRTKNMTRDQLISVQRFAHADANPIANTPVYNGMNRSDTIATATRTAQDTQLALNHLAITAFLGG